tara:strand:- start:266 stop:385 length:120 start_codon:yes stop_codon:yes gene_type:complete
MTFFHGLGMFFLGIGALFLSSIIIYFIVNEVMKEKKNDE